MQKGVFYVNGFLDYSYNQYYLQPKIMFEEIQKIAFQCNLKLLKKKIIMLIGFPSIKVDCEKIHLYLKGILEENQFEQLKKLRILISFIGEVTQINNWDDRVQIIRQRVSQLFNIQGIEIKWNEEQWKKEVNSIVTNRTNNHYYNTTTNTIFSYANLFNSLQMKVPKYLQNLNHHSFNQIQTSNLIDDFHLLCDINEFITVRYTRNFIQNITNKLDEFMNLLIDIEIKTNFIEYNIRTRYQTLCEQLQEIVNKFTFVISQQNELQNNQQYKLSIQKQQFQKYQELAFETQTLTTSKTKILQDTLQSKSKKLKKQIKSENHLHYRSSILYSINQGDITQLYFTNQCFNSSQNEAENENFNDLIFKIQTQLLKYNQFNFENSQNFEYTLEKIQQKILTYEYIQYQFEQLGYPSINFDDNELIQVLLDYKLYNSNNKNLIVILFNIISESFISENGCMDVSKSLQDKALTYLQQLSIDIPIKELNAIQTEQCIIKANMQVYGNLPNRKFSYQLLSQIINRQFPEEIYKIQCSSTKLIFQQWSIQPLLDIVKFQELKNIRETRSFINQIYTCLQVLINFKEKLQNNFDNNLLYDFFLMEKEFIDIINQPLNFHVNSNQFLKTIQNLNQFDDLFLDKQRKEEIVQVEKFDMIQEFKNQQNEQWYSEIIDQKNQGKMISQNEDYPIIQDQFSFESYLNQLDSPKISGIHSSQFQPQDQQLYLDEEYYNYYFSM